MRKACGSAGSIISIASSSCIAGLPTAAPGRDVVLVASLDEHVKAGYGIGLPFGGRWRELFNSDYYDSFPNPAPTGNGGWVDASGSGLDGFAHSAMIMIPANGALFLAPE